MACTLHDTASSSLISKPNDPRYTNGQLGRALLLCRWVVKSVEPFIFPLALLLSFSLLLTHSLTAQLMASPLFSLLHPILAFLVRKLRKALAFVLLTSSIGLLCFLFTTILMNSTSADEAVRPAALVSKRERKANKKEELSSSMDYDDYEIDPDVTMLISTWLFEYSIPCELKARDLLSQEDEGLSDQQAQAAEKEISACTAQSGASVIKLPSHVNGSAANTNDTEVHQLQTKANPNKHSRSSSYTCGLNPDGTSSSADVAEPLMRGRRESVSCDWGSSTESNYSPALLQNTHADLHSPPLPLILAFNGSKSSSERQEENAFVLQSQLAPWRVSSPQSTTTPREHEKAAETPLKPPHLIDYSKIFNGNISSSQDELREQSDAFIAKRQEQWRLQRLESLQKLSN